VEYLLTMKIALFPKSTKWFYFLALLFLDDLARI